MAGPNMQKNVSLAGQSVKQGNYTVTYDERGYATKAVQDGGRSATSTVKTTRANDSAAHQKAYQAAQNGDWDAVGAAVNEIAYGGSYDPAKGYDFTEANAYMNELQDEFKYNANDYYQGKYDAVYGEGAWDGGTGTGKPTYPTSGSSVSGGGTGGSNSGISGGDYMSFDDFLAGTGYDQYADATQAAIKAAVQNAVNGYRDQINTTNRDSDELARQAYIAKMLGQKNLDQQMEANGYAGGMADSQRIATETDYQNQLSEIEKMRLQTVKELESAITNAQLTGDMQTAQELSDYLQTIQGQWMDYMQFQQSLDNQNYWNQQNLDNQNYWNQQNLNAQNTESARSWAMQQIAMGIMPEDEILTAAGISKQAAQQQVALVLTGGTQGTKKTTSSTTPSKPRLTLAQTQEALKNGIVNESTLNAYEYYYGEPYKVDATNSDNKVPVSPPNYSTVVKNSSSGYYGKAFNVVLNNVQAQRNRGANLETLAGTIEDALNKGDITKAGAQSLMQALGIGQ